MIYSTPEFVLFFILTLAVYVLAKDRWLRLSILLGTSLYYYSRTGIRDTAIFAFVVVTSWLCVAAARRWPVRKHAILGAGIALMVLHLFFWKYASWAASQVQRVWPGFLGGAGIQLPLPVGISFFTLQGIAYLVDFTNDNAKYMGLPTYCLFKSFFAQLIAGPIVRARQLLPQLERLESPSWDDIAFGLSLFTLGFFKKLAIADRLAPLVDEVFRNPADFSRIALIKAVLAYSAQIWADFSGYTDMGRGAARMLGFHLPENFLSPYLAQSPSEFWRRWHITLSEWIRDYLYIPMGGGRGSPARALGVVVLVMSLSGLWHGASWHFLLWGLYHGGLLVLDRKLDLGKKPTDGWGLTTTRTALTFAFVAFGWVIFRAPSLTSLAQFCIGFVRDDGQMATAGRGLAAILALTAFIQVVGYCDLERQEWPLLSRIRQSSMGCSFATSHVAAFGFGVLLAAVFAGAIFMQPYEAPSFIYFQF